ncbi:MAG: hypothetical protein R2778_09290 [Saprospiraceae bacterium]
MLYDAIVLFMMFALADYPLEKVMLLFVSINPIDLARVAVLLQLDISALMGYTGAIFREFLGTWWGIAYAFHPFRMGNNSHAHCHSGIQKKGLVRQNIYDI